MWLCSDICTHQRPCLEVAVVGAGVGEVVSREAALLAQAQCPQWGSHSPIYKQCRVKQMHCTPYGWRSCLLLRDNPLIHISAQPLDPLPVLSDFPAEEKKISELQTGFITRLRKSPYYVVETVKTHGQVVFTCAHLTLIYSYRARAIFRQISPNFCITSYSQTERPTHTLFPNRNVRWLLQP